MSKNDKLDLRQNTCKAVSIVNFMRRPGKLSQKSLALLFDTYYFACKDGFAGLSFGEDFDQFAPITPGLEEDTSPLDVLASALKKRKRN